ncbi:flap endonuclease Xni [Pseudoalteromonas ardens]|uniref:Protein Xni n=1 Tax=Pseudoalteromonas rubra TaxID=43658 RepID=A0A0L0EQU3_9GAMM|nr:flap endonuclease Xni [Pseudoalteromonas sp. R96]KNC66258.1 protein Xni [Pseudoalteromonas rubra]MDK1309969.1 flap endonuclease Xni [Pseudoalteromonas sp. R96]
MAKLLLIDALNLIRRIYAVDVDQQGVSEKQIMQSCKARVHNACKKLLKRIEPTHAIAVFDGERSWRYHYYANYKHSRKPMPEPLKQNLALIAEGFKECGVTAFFPEQDEADDIIATLASKASHNKVHAVIVSTDKGFLPLSSGNIEIYNYFSKSYYDHNEILEKFSVPYNALTELWALMGDKTNDIPGVKGIGKKTAIELISEFGQVEHALTAPTLAPATRRKLEQDLDNFILSKTLVSLQTDINLGFNLSQLRVIERK